MADIEQIRASNGSGEATRAVVTDARSPLALTLQVNSVTNFPQKFIGTWGKLNQTTLLMEPNSVRVFYGQLNGTNIDILSMAPGYTDDGNDVGDVVVLKPTTAWADEIADGLQVSHNQDGTLNASALAQIYPIGSIYINASVSTNPATLLGFGTWVAFGAGRVPVGFDSTQSEFNAAEKTGGAKTHTLTIAQMPSHSHSTPLSNSSSAGYSHVWRRAPGSGDGNISTNSQGGGQAHNNLQPYITVRMWKRTA